MWDPEKYKIVFYLAWSGAEATQKFESKAQYDAARAFLDTIATTHVSGDKLPLKYSGKVADFYLIEKEQRAAFQKFMMDIAN